MQDWIDQFLEQDAELRPVLVKIFKEVIINFKRITKDRMLSRQERKGMFITQLRSRLLWITERPNRKNHKGRWRYNNACNPEQKGFLWPPEYYDKSLLEEDPQNRHLFATRRDYNAWKRIRETLLNTDYWYDAGQVSESRISKSGIVRSLMEQAWKEADDELATTDSQLVNLDSILNSMKVCIQDAQRLNKDLAFEATKTSEELKKIFE